MQMPKLSQPSPLKLALFEPHLQHTHEAVLLKLVPFAKISNCLKWPHVKEHAEAVHILVVLPGNL